MEYRASIVTFMDILGFKQLVESGNAATIKTVLETLQEAAEPDGETAQMFEMAFLTFSDCTVRTVPLDSKTNLQYPGGLLWYELLNLMYSQYRLFVEGYLLRGGVTIGEIAVKGPTIFGPALVQAYSLESEFAVYPRIVVDPIIFEIFQRDPRLLKKDGHSVEVEKTYLRKVLRKDSDGLYFIDYLGGMLTEFDDEGDEFDYLERHKKFIESQVAQLRGLSKVTAKYLWLAHYHNTVVREMDGSCFEAYELNRRDYMVDHLVTKDGRSLLHEL